MCRLRHINDPVLSSLKMEGIRLLYFVMRRGPEHKGRSIRWTLYGRLGDQGYADDVCLLSQIYGDTYEQICNLEAEAATAGL
jgi:hypothetical protein